MIDYTYIILSNISMASSLTIIVTLVVVIFYALKVMESGYDAKIASLEHKKYYEEAVKVCKKYLKISILIFIVLLIIYIIVPSEEQLNLLYNIKQ